MKRAIALLAVLSACAPITVAGAAQSVLIVARSTVTTLAADSDNVAYATSRSALDTCDHVFLWQRPTHRAFQLGKNKRCAGEHGVAGLAVPGGRVLWVTWAGGKVHEWQLWTATGGRTAPRQLLSDTRSADEQQPIIVGSAGGGLLPYAVDSAVTVLRSNGSTAFSWSGASSVVALAAAGGRVAVVEQGGRVTVLDARGKVASVDLYASDVSAVAFVAKGLLVQRGSLLEHRREAETHEYTISADSRLVAAEGRSAVWSDGKVVHVMRLLDGAQTATFVGSWATLVGNRLYIANGRTITVRTIR